jgi:hypothetical protein
MESGEPDRGFGIRGRVGVAGAKRVLRVGLELYSIGREAGSAFCVGADSMSSSQMSLSYIHGERSDRVDHAAEANPKIRVGYRGQCVEQHGKTQFRLIWPEDHDMNRRP